MKKAVFKVGVDDDKAKNKVLKTIAALSGVDSISMDMKEKKLTVTGDIDPVSIVSNLRKLCHTEIVSVGSTNKPEKKDDEKKKEDDEKKKEDDEKKKIAELAHAYGNVVGKKPTEKNKIEELVNADGNVLGKKPTANGCAIC